MSDRWNGWASNCRVIFALALMLTAVPILLLQIFPRSAISENPVEAAQHDLSDMHGHWAAADVRLLNRIGVVDAYPDGTFGPESPVTRAETAKMAVAAFDVMQISPVDESSDVTYPPSSYFDIADSHWVLSFVYSAQAADLLSGYPDGTFQPEAYISRAEVAEVFYRVFGSPEPDEEFLDTYTDSDAIPEWARASVAWCTEVGLIFGFPDGTFRAGAVTSRAEAAVIVKRALQLRGCLYTMQGEIVDVSADAVVMALPGEQVVEIDLSDAQVHRGAIEIQPATLHRGEYLSVILDASGGVVWAEVPHLSFSAILEGIDFGGSILRLRPLHPADNPENEILDSWVGTAYLSAGGQADELRYAEPVGVHWDSRTEVYRQGAAARVESLRPGDRVNVALWPDSPVARYVDAVRYDSWGVIEQVEPGERPGTGTFSWRGADGTLNSGSVTANTRYDASGMKTDFSALRTGYYVGVVTVRGSSQVSYVEVFGPTSAMSRDDHRRGSPLSGPAFTPSIHQPTAVDLHAEAPSPAALPSYTDVGWIVDDPVPGPFESNSRLVRATAVSEYLGVDGTGVVVAVVDTGVDPLTPLVFGETGGVARLVDWKDFTGGLSLSARASAAPVGLLAEGDILTSHIVQMSGDEFYLQGETFTVTGPIPEDGLLRCGWVGSSFFFPGQTVGGDVLVAALRTNPDEGYDALYIDVDGDGILSEDELFLPVNRGGSAGIVDYSDDDMKLSANFVVTEIDPDGRLVNLGFDGNGHGTQVAGVVAGTDSGSFGGMAPGVGIMALKALSSDGSGSWADVVEAVRYAAEHGADIINVSVTGLYDLSSGSTRESQMLAEIAQEHDVLIVTAVGNRGPGLATAYTPGDSQWTLSVGAVALPEIVLRDYGYQLPQPTVWEYSSVGPRADGALAPSLLAPGSVYTPVAEWLSPRGWAFFEGTSCAAAHVAGSAALLVEAARERDLPLSMQGVKRALEAGARSIPDYLLVEQGFGVLDVEAAWYHLRRDPTGVAAVQLGVSSGVMVERPLQEHDPQGIYLRDTAPGVLHLTLRNLSDEPSTVLMDLPGLDLIRLPLHSVNIPGNAEIGLPVKYDISNESSELVSGFVTADDTRTPGVDAQLLHTIITPVVLSPENPRIISSGQLDPGRWQRYFVRVPEGTTHLDVNLDVPGPEDGRVSYQIIDPLGERVHVSSPIGAGSYDPWGYPIVNESRIIENPRVGVWEIIVSSAPALSFYGLTSSSYRFTADILGRGSVVLSADRSEWRYSCTAAAPDYIDVDVRIAADGAIGEVSALMHDLSPVGVGWVSAPEQVVVVPRQRIRSGHDDVHYTEFEVPAATDLLILWSGNPSPACAELEVFLYRYGADGRTEEVLYEPQEGYIQLRRPIPGEYLLITRAKSGDACEYEVMVEAWPAVREVQVNGPALGAHGGYQLWARLAVPSRPGSYWASVGLQAADGRILSRVWLHVEVEGGEVLFSPSSIVSPFSAQRLVVRNYDDLSPAGGVVLIDDRLYTLDGDGEVSISPLHPQRGHLSSFEVRFNSGADEWSAPVPLSATVLSREELSDWRRGLLPLLAGGALDNPVIRARWEGFSELPGDTWMLGR